MKKSRALFLVTTSALGAALSILLMVGCSTTTHSKPRAAESKEAPATASTSLAQKGGAELWGQNCGHCHNVRSPSSYSDAQWEVVMLHMRVRANLTADEHKKILAFLKSAH